MSYSLTQQRALALAALVQPVWLVHTIARRGQCDAACFAQAVQMLFADGHDALSLYGNEISHLHRGLSVLEQLLGGAMVGSDAKPMLIYAANLIGLEKQLRHHPDMIKYLADGIERTRKQAGYFDNTLHDNVIASLAGIYGETISHLKPKVVVRGKPEFLRQTANTNRIRVLLLAALRGAHYWHRAGGSHWRLLLGRRGLRKEVTALLR
ncbi:MAG: DUF489 family protein [Mariprofundales bacterium]|nr:DUF489 family protein [Mariprofundales bacterium]